MRVSSIGEILVDMIPKKPGGYCEGISFEAHLGGAPFNYAVAMARLGAIPYGMGAVGNDSFGNMLLRTLRDNGVRTECVKVKSARTSLAFVILKENGEREFFFYRSPWARTADTMYSIDDLSTDVIVSSRVLYVSGMALSVGPLRDAVLKAMEVGSESNTTVIFDYNVRPDVWSSMDDLRSLYDRALGMSSAISLSIDEAEVLYNIKDPLNILSKLKEKHPKADILIKLGDKGCLVYVDGCAVLVEPYKVQAVDTTGAGDAWVAAFSYYYYLRNYDIEKASIMANALGAITVTRRGTITAFASKGDLERFVKERDCPNVKHVRV